MHYIISEILLPSHKRGKGLAGPYIPTFYQNFGITSADVSRKMEGVVGELVWVGWGGGR